ncbi:cystathionine beta-lyase [Hyphomicrobium sp.]|uniref:cystathionine beta-lyase n=1 Tax=Hyphomicrobium sp. TaxID=82 RepID=UPI002E359C69|nr:cystathionine beta-lyase [Hyphomicrobium sp.]HEX2843362.1 cystathionine beta-lyase [Hyphomicrobium sp.]
MTKPQKGSGKSRHPATTLLHSGRNAPAQHGFVNPPVYRGSTVLFPTLDALEAYDQPFKYGRHGTPTTAALEEAICQLEGGARTLLTASGYQAVTTAILAFVKAGDHILMVDSVYQPTRRFCDTILARLGVATTYYDPLVGADIADLIQPNTRVVFTESPGSLTFEMQDIGAIAKAARARDVAVIMDNTWATPLYFRPLAHGVDVSINACTKYIVGHADAMLGAITANERTAKLLEDARATLGGCPGSEETYLGLRGLRTLAVRLERHQRSGLEVARWLAARPEVERVLHPALPADPGHALWKAQYTGASGLFSVILKPTPRKALAAMLDGLELFGMGYSWGGFESLIIPFNPKHYRTATAWTAEGPALRLHIGLDDVGDLIADLEAGFARLNASR